MKKNIILAAALTLICLNNLFAQERATVNASTTRNFTAKFLNATDVRWEPQKKGISLAKFRLEGETWIAYYSPEGDLITSGRKITSTDQLPVKVKRSLQEVQDKYATKYGSLELGSIFEMVGDNGTQYYIPLENGQVDMMVAFDGYGSISILRKESHLSPIAIDKAVIAKKN